MCRKGNRKVTGCFYECSRYIFPFYVLICLNTRRALACLLLIYTQCDQTIR